MDIKKYTDEVLRNFVVEDTNERLKSLALGMCGESGEVVDAVKKHLYYGKSVDLTRELLREELGDVLWYISAIAQCYALTLDDIADNNARKLRERYGHLPHSPSTEL